MRLARGAQQVHDDQRDRAAPAAVLSAVTAVVLLAWFAVGVVLAAPARAHAVLLASEPADEQALDSSPDAVVLRFSEPVEVPPQAIQVFDAAGERVDAGATGYGTDRAQLTAALPGDLGEGFFTVTWRAVSADGHPIRGSFTFTVGEVAPGGRPVLPGAAGTGGELGWEVMAALARFAVYAGTLLAAGGAVFMMLVHDGHAAEARALTRLLAVAAAVAVAGSVVGVPVYAVLSSGLGWRGLTSAEALAGALGSGVGLAALARVGGLALLVAGLPGLRRPAGAALAGVGALAALGSFLLSGHTAASEPRVLVLASDLVHTGAASVWFGGLVLLTIVLRRRSAAHRPDAAAAPPPARPAGAAPPGGAVTTAVAVLPAASGAVAGAQVVRRFSTVALASVLALSVAGLALAWVEVRALEALVATAYGWTLLAKVALVAAVVAVAAHNRRNLVGKVARAGDSAWRSLRATVRLEAAGLVAVVAVTAVLVALVPARTAAGIGEPFVGYLPLGAEHQVNIVVDPARTGRNEIHLYLLDSAGQLADIGEEVRLRMSLPAAGIAPIEREPFVAGPGHWLYLGSDLSVPGAWRIEVQVLVSEFERLNALAEVDIGGRAQ